MISPETIQEIKEKLDIVSVIQEYVSLKRRGANYVGICPFHADSKPSLTVNKIRQSYKCFVCAEGGDVIKFVREYNKITFLEAIKILAEKAGVEIEEKEFTNEEKSSLAHKQSLLNTLGGAKKYFEGNLPQINEYLQKRGFDFNDKVLSDFGVGYSPEGNKSLNELKTRGYNVEFLFESGVVAKSEKGFYSVFRDRVVFPFYNQIGQIIGFTGRFINPQENTGKYINSPETELFIKGKVIFGLRQSLRCISHKNSVYLCEGQFDVLSLHKYGVENAICGSGTAFTEAQAKILLKYTENVTLIYDNDKAGVSAAFKTADLLHKNGAKCKFIALGSGEDPDNLAQKLKSKTGEFLEKNSLDMVDFFVKIKDVENADPIIKSELLNELIAYTGSIQDNFLKRNYIEKAAKIFKQKQDIIKASVNKIKSANKELLSGIFGLEEADNFFSKNELESKEMPCELTNSMEYFLDNLDEKPVILIQGLTDISQIHKLRGISSYFISSEKGINVLDGNESDYLKSLAMLFKNGVQKIEIKNENCSISFLDAYLQAYKAFFDNESPADLSFYIDKCCELISYSSDSVQVCNEKRFSDLLGLAASSYKKILNSHNEKHKSKKALAKSGTYFENFNDNDPDKIPDYVQNNPEYTNCLKHYGFYPYLNEQQEPVAYMFKSSNSNLVKVADFYMKPLLHIYDSDPTNNKRIVQINRQHYPKPILIEFNSEQLLSRSTIESVLINEEGVNFVNGKEEHWKTIRTYNSYNFMTCTEITTYGNQQEDGSILRKSDNFFAFSNAIFHYVDGNPVIDLVNELGVVEHEGDNYYLPAFSTLYSTKRKEKSKYDTIRTIFYKEIPENKRCSFERWAQLMNQVYKLNDNGKWAILYAIMSAFRSNIHHIDRLFTALFFIGPPEGGKTQIAISIRSLFIDKNAPAFNLNTGSDAAMSVIMSLFRDIPVVLDEYNNKDISDIKFQSLKAIVYDGDGRQKRKGVGNKEIEIDRIYSPVVLLGQEQPTRDDNSLMTRVIICEVPKPKERTEDEDLLFKQLKDIEDHNKIGLSNVLIEVLKLRPVVQEHWKSLWREAFKELKKALPLDSGDMTRITNTVSLFLTMIKVIENHSDLKLPFTYSEFFEIAKRKILSQVQLISRSDKLSSIFKAMDVMIDTGTLKQGRDFDVEVPRNGKISIQTVGTETKELVLEKGKKVLFLRFSDICINYSRSSYNEEKTSQATLEQNLRSHPSFLGYIRARRFNWPETHEVPRDSINKNPIDQTLQVEDSVMVKVVKKTGKTTSCYALDYDIFKDCYDIDFEREIVKKENKTSEQEEVFPF